MSDLQTLDREVFSDPDTSEQTLIENVSGLFNMGISRYIEHGVEVERRKLTEFLEEMGMFGLTHGINPDQIEEVQRTLKETAKQKRFRNVKVLVTDKPYVPEEDSTIIVFDGIKQYKGSQNSVVRKVTINGEMITNANMPDFEDIPHLGKKKLMVLVFEKTSRTTLDGAEAAAVMDAVMDMAGPGAGTEQLEEIRAALENGEAAPEILDIVETVAEIAALEQVAQEPGAPEEIQAQIETLKENLAELLQSPEVVAIVPPALIEAVQATMTEAAPLAAEITAETVLSQEMPVQQVETVLAQVETLLAADGFPPEAKEAIAEMLETIHTSLDGGDIEAVGLQMADMKVQLMELVPAENLPPQIFAKVIDILPAISATQAQVVAAVQAAQAVPAELPSPVKIDMTKADVQAVVEALNTAKIDPAQIEKIQSELQSGDISKATLDILNKTLPEHPVTQIVAAAMPVAAMAENVATKIESAQPQVNEVVKALADSGLDQKQLNAIQAELQSGQISKTTLDLLSKTVPDHPVTQTITSTVEQAALVASVVESRQVTTVELSQPETKAVVDALTQSGMDKTQIEAIKTELQSGKITPETLEILSRSVPGHEITQAVIAVARDAQTADQTPIARETQKLVVETVKNDPAISETKKVEIIRALESGNPDAIKILAKANPDLAEVIVRQNAAIRVAEKASEIAERLQNHQAVKNDPVLREALSSMKEGRVPPRDVLEQIKNKVPELRNEIKVLERRNDERLARLPDGAVNRDMQKVAQVLRESGHNAAAKEVERLVRENPQMSADRGKQLLSQMPKDLFEKVQLADKKVQQEKEPLVVLKNADPRPVLESLARALPFMPPEFAKDIQTIQQQVMRGEAIDKATLDRVFEKMPEKEQVILAEAIAIKQPESALGQICENCPHGGDCTKCGDPFAGASGKSLMELRQEREAGLDTSLQNQFGGAQSTMIKGRNQNIAPDPSSLKANHGLNLRR